MKRLFLLRHALALPAEGGRDKDRALAPKGLEDARALGALMERKHLKPDLIVCSDARRTVQTCEALSEKFAHKISTLYSKALYDASRGDLFYMAQNADKDVSALMLIGHNPSIYELCVMLASGGPAALLGRLDQGYAPATLSVFDLPIDRWPDLNPETSTLCEYLAPSDYNSPSPARWT